VTQLNFQLPLLGQGNASEDPKIHDALAEIQTVVNGQLGSDNIQDGGLQVLDLATGTNGLASQAVSVRRTAPQAITVGATPTTVQLNVEDFDVSGVFDAVTNYRYTPLVAGVYRVSASTSWPAFDGYAQTLLYKNNALLQTLAMARNTLVDGGTFGGSCLVQMNGSTDFLELRAAYDDAGVAHNVNQAMFCAELVGRV
jgi:hypothetical protein